MNERELPGLECPLRIVALALEREYPEYSRDHASLSREFFWYADSTVDRGQAVLMRAVIDKSEDEVRNAISKIDIGVVSKEDASSMWITIPKHSILPYLQVNNQSLGHGLINDDPYVTDLVGHYKGLTPEHGELVSDKVQLGQIAEFLVTQALTDYSSSQIRASVMAPPQTVNFQDSCA
ncbi:hypothetical protein BH23PAT2_BH23PAT2_03550 [soil metagenome]